MSIQKKFQKMYITLLKKHRIMCVKKSNKNHFKMLKNNNIPIKKLTSEQKNSIDKVYKKYYQKYSYHTHELCYSISGKFDPYIMPEDLFRTQIELKLNDLDYKNVLTDKNYFDLFMPDIKFPDTIIKNINGNFYDNEYNLISYNQATNIIKKYDKIVFKPSKESGFGRSVKLLDTKECLSLLEKNKNAKDYIIQKLLIQNKFLSKLNDSSVNIIRVVTVFLDNEVYNVTSALRIGGEGSFTDNYSTSDGKGMIIVGINEDGSLKEKGYYSSGISTKTSTSGELLKGKKIPKYKEMVEIAKRKHKMFPNIRFIGWDFTLDEKENIIVMEYNAKSPGVLYYQYCNGALFGKNTEKILEIINDNLEKK